MTGERLLWSIVGGALQALGVLCAVAIVTSTGDDGDPNLAFAILSALCFAMAIGAFEISRHERK